MFFVSDYPERLRKTFVDSNSIWQYEKIETFSHLQDVIVKFQNGSLEKAVMPHPIQNTHQKFSIKIKLNKDV